MKKLLLTAALAMACGSFAFADPELVANVFSDSGQNVTWDNTLTISADKFADAAVGNYIEVTFSNTTDVIEFKSDGTWLPGSNNSWLGEGVESRKTYITADGLAALQANGLELCGANFTVTSVDIFNDGFQMPEGAVWGGYFWIDNGWNTLEIFKSAFAKYNGQRYLDIYLTDEVNGDDYEMKVLTKWEPETLVASNDQLQKNGNRVTVDLQGVNLSEMLADVNQLMIQGHNKLEDGNGNFNIKAVALRAEAGSQTPPTEGDGDGDGDGEEGGEQTPTTPANVVTTLYQGEAVSVTWETPLEFDAEKFETLEVGDYILVTFGETTDVIEAKANGVWVPGTLFTWLGEGAGDYNFYVTEGGLAAIQEYGLQITGAQFTVTGVYICNDGFQMPEGAVWGGYFWIDGEFNTMNIFKTAFANYDGEKYMDIYLSDDGQSNDYELKVLTNWEPETLIASNEEIEHGTTMATVDLEGIDLTEWLENVDALMIQGHTEGTPFNITAVVLRDGETAIISVLNSSDEVTVYNLQGLTMKSNVKAGEALENLPKGIYVLKSENGVRKVVK